MNVEKDDKKKKRKERERNMTSDYEIIRKKIEWMI